jgi:hypothetical protein
MNSNPAILDALRHAHEHACHLAHLHSLYFNRAAERQRQFRLRVMEAV